MNSKITENTIVGQPRLDRLLEYAALTRDVPGDVSEVGVYKGGTALLLAEAVADAKWLLLFDTFQGMPEVSEWDLHHKGDFADTSVDHVANLLRPFRRRFAIYPGLFSDNTHEHEERAFSLVHLDCDIYTSVRDCIAFFAPRMSPGGIMVFDDVYEPNCPGALKAALEYGKPLENRTQSQAVFRF